MKAACSPLLLNKNALKQGRRVDCTGGSVNLCVCVVDFYSFITLKANYRSWNILHELILTYDLIFSILLN